jgi:hypothetical protein
MRRTFLAGLALICLAACGPTKDQPALARARPPAVQRRTTTPKKQVTTPARKPTRKSAAPEDTASPRNPLLNH